MNKFSLCATLCVILQACAQQPYYGDLNYLAKFPSSLSEVSGMVQLQPESVWVIEDNGNKDVLYKVSSSGKIIKKLKVKNAKNNDWEDLTQDTKGNVYIGDFGNNANERKNLVIYKVPNPETEPGDKIDAEKIRFYYPDQMEFPPKKEKRFFDAEGLIHWKDHLYVFTKDRSRPYQGKTLVYRVPDKKGTYAAELVGTIQLCKNQDHCSVTGAAISEDGSTLALLGYGYLYTATNFDLNTISKATFETKYLKYDTQIESICFEDDTTLLIADERSKSTGRNLYRYQL